MRQKSGLTTATARRITRRGRGWFDALGRARSSAPDVDRLDPLVLPEADVVAVLRSQGGRFDIRGLRPYATVAEMLDGRLRWVAASDGTRFGSWI